MRYRLQRHDGTDCSATMVPITVLRMVPIQRYRQFLFHYQDKRLPLYLLLHPYFVRILAVTKIEKNYVYLLYK